jgi:hypothetical protein
VRLSSLKLAAKSNPIPILIFEKTFVERILPSAISANFPSVITIFGNELQYFNAGCRFSCGIIEILGSLKHLNGNQLECSFEASNHTIASSACRVSLEPADLMDVASMGRLVLEVSPDVRIHKVSPLQTGKNGRLHIYGVNFRSLPVIELVISNWFRQELVAQSSSYFFVS